MALLKRWMGTMARHRALTGVLGLALVAGLAGGGVAISQAVEHQRAERARLAYVHGMAQVDGWARALEAQARTDFTKLVEESNRLLADSDGKVTTPERANLRSSLDIFTPLLEQALPSNPTMDELVNSRNRFWRAQRDIQPRKQELAQALATWEKGKTAQSTQDEQTQAEDQAKGKQQDDLAEQLNRGAQEQAAKDKQRRADEANRKRAEEQIRQQQREQQQREQQRLAEEQAKREAEAKAKAEQSATPTAPPSTTVPTPTVAPTVAPSTNPTVQSTGN